MNLDDALGGREGGQYEQRIRHHCSRHSLCNEARASALELELEMELKLELQLEPELEDLTNGS